MIRRQNLLTRKEKLEAAAGGGESKDEPSGAEEAATEATTLRALLETMNAELEGIVVRQNLVDERMSHTVFRKSHTGTTPEERTGVMSSKAMTRATPRDAPAA